MTLPAREPRRRGLSMVEAVIALAVSAALLVAAGAAFTASASAVQANADFSRAAQSARVALSQMATEVRRADAVSLPSASAASTYFDVIRPAETRTANETSRRYRYDATAKVLYLDISYSGGGATATYTLASNVTAASFGPPQTGTDAAGQTVVQRVPMMIGVKVGKNYVALNGSAAPRRAVAN